MIDLRQVRPFGVVIGGAKVADKLGVIEALIEKADMVRSRHLNVSLFIFFSMLCVAAVSLLCTIRS